ncbi:MAG TPA: hypothetical protein VEQ35_00825 [Beijerinckia sp.]|jgi:hypothetical protein|nr:hypothetical protein [Beijerinckia sp.]
MDKGVQELLDAVFGELRAQLFSRGFTLEEACSAVAKFMDHRYGVANYVCNADVKKALAERFNTTPELQGTGSNQWTPRQ